MVFYIGIYKLDIDVERTSAFYAAEDGIPWPCGCANCRNFDQAIRLLPEPVKAFFQSLGIDPSLPAETWANFAPTEDTVHYGGFYHICGRILKGTDPWIRLSKNHRQLDPQYRIELHKGHSMFFIAEADLLEPGFPQPVIQMDIEFILPWVLDEPNPNYVAEL